MKTSLKRPILKILKVTGISIGSILLLMFLLPILLPGFRCRQNKSLGK
jgi:AsmA protein